MLLVGLATEDGDKMSALWPETQPDIERMQVERLRQMPAWRKMALMAEMTESVRTLALAGLRHRYPTDTPTQRRRRLADLLLGPELAARAYGPSPEEG
jgi:negative regulator of sigma E activity